MAFKTGGGTLKQSTEPASPQRFQISMRTALSVGVIAAVLLSAAIVHFPWSVTSRTNIADLNMRLNAQVIRSIAEKIDGLLDNAVAARQAIATNLTEGVIDVGEESKREFLFLSFLQSQPSLTAIEFAWLDDHSFLARRAGDGTIRMEEVVPSDAGASRRVDTYRVTDDGELMFESRNSEAADYRASQQFWFLTAFDADQPVWSNIYRSPTTDSLTVTTTRTVQRDGNLLGVLGVSISLDRLSAFLDGIEIGGASSVFLTNIYNELVALQRQSPNLSTRPPAREIQKLQDVVHPAVRVTVAAVAESGATLRELKGARQINHHDAASGETYFVTLAPLEQMGLVAAVVIPESEVLGAINRNTQLLLAALAAFVVLIGLAATFVARRALGTPLASVAQNMRELEDFRLDRVSPIASRFSEIRQVSAATTRMSASLASFNKYIPTELVRTLFAQGIEAELGGERRDLTILFMDIAGFTGLAEQFGDRLIEFLGDYLSDMSTTIQERHGTIDKYIGDAIMAFWGAPLTNDLHAVDACRAALACQARLTELRSAHKAKGYPELRARIGINTGHVLVGNVGSRDRLNYTAIGDAVNVAARLESLNKVYGTGILIGEKTYEDARAEIVARPLDRVAVYGRETGLQMYELLAMAADADSGLRDWLAVYERGRAAFQGRDWDAAIALFEKTTAMRGGRDPVSTLQIGRARQFKATPPPPEWDGLVTMESK